jgi:hypothetical protein
MGVAGGFSSLTVRFTIPRLKKEVPEMVGITVLKAFPLTRLATAVFPSSQPECLSLCGEKW